MTGRELAALGYFGLGQVDPRGGVGSAGLPTRYAAQPYAPVGSGRSIPGYPYGMRGMAGFGEAPGQAMANYPPAPMPQGLPAQSYWATPPYFTHTAGYKDALAAAGLEFHTEVFDLTVDPIAQSGSTLAAGASVIATVRISQEADFVAEKITEFSTDSNGNCASLQNGNAAAAGWAPDYTLQIFDNATNRALENIATRRSNLAGTAARPRIIKPRLFRRNSDISFLFTAASQNPTTINRLQVTFSGYKIFDPNALSLNNPQ